MQQSIRTTTEMIVTMVTAMNEWPLHASEVAEVIQATAVNHVEIQVIAVNLHPWNRLHEHDSDDILTHWRAYTFCYSLQRKNQSINISFMVSI